MKSKQIYALIGAIVLILIFVWMGNKGDVAQDTNKETVTPTTQTPVVQNKKPSSQTSQVPTSVNPTIVPEKPIPTIPTPKSLAGSTFRLTTYNGTPLPSDTKFTLSFTEFNFNIKLCNTFSSNYFMDSSNYFRVGNVATTAAYCSSPSNIMKIESDLSLMFNSGNTAIYRSGSTLILSHNSGATLSFEGF